MAAIISTLNFTSALLLVCATYLVSSLGSSTLNCTGHPLRLTSIALWGWVGRQQALGAPLITGKQKPMLLPFSQVHGSERCSWYPLQVPLGTKYQLIELHFPFIDSTCFPILMPVPSSCSLGHRSLCLMLCFRIFRQRYTGFRKILLAFGLRKRDEQGGNRKSN